MFNRKEAPVQLFTYFGVKKKVVEQVWQAWGDVDMTIEPFAGTAVTSLSRPENHNVKVMYLNDKDCHVANVLRSVLYHPDIVINQCCHPRLELDMHMIHDYLVNYKGTLSELLKTSFCACNPVLAGLWVWGCNSWIGGNWCAEKVIHKKVDELCVNNTYNPCFTFWVP